MHVLLFALRLGLVFFFLVFFFQRIEKLQSVFKMQSQNRLLRRWMWKTKLQFLNFKASILNLWSNLLAVLWHFQHRLTLRSDKCLGRNVTLKNVTAELHYVTLWSVCVSVTWLMTCVLPKKQKKNCSLVPFTPTAITLFLDVGWVMTLPVPT